VSALRVLIVDDEKLAREGVRALLETEPDVRIAGECANGASAVEAIRAGGVDVVLLDVQMPGMSGLDVLRQIEPKAMPSVVFVTAHAEFALQGFEVDAADYLVKPFTDARLNQAIGRARQRIQAQPSTSLDVIRRFPLQVNGETVFLQASLVDWLEADGYCTRLHVADDVHLVRGHLAAFQRVLDPNRFFRVHRSCIVNLERVRSMRRWSKGDTLLVLSNGTEIEVSRDRRGQLVQAMRRLPDRGL